MALRAERLQLAHGGHGSHGSHQALRGVGTGHGALQAPMQAPMHSPPGGPLGPGPRHHQHHHQQHYHQQQQQQQQQQHALASPSRASRAVQPGGGGRPLRPLNAVCAAKRKSAVELLQESKAFYVKSDCVLDRQQRLQRPTSSPPCSPSPSAASAALNVPLPLSSALLSPPPSPSPLSSPCSGVPMGMASMGPMGVEPMPPAPPGFQQEAAPVSAPTPRALLLPKSPRLGSAGTTWGQRRAASQQLQSDRLQNKLRRLLNADSKENVFYDPAVGGEDDRDDAHTVAGERAASRLYGRSNSQTQHSYSSRTWSYQPPVSTSLHKSLPDLHASPTPARPAVPRWSSDNSSTRGGGGSSTSSHSGDGCGYTDFMHRRSGSQRGSRSLHYSGDSMSVVSSGGRSGSGRSGRSGRTQQSHRSQPAPAPALATSLSARERDRETCGELRRGGSSGSSSGARTHRSQPEGRTRANTVSEALVRQSSGGSSAALSGMSMSSWSPSPRYRSRPTSASASQYHSVRNASAEELDASRGSSSRGSRGSLGSRGSSQKSDHENYSSPPHCSRVAELCWNFEPRRPILRSKSDISHRYSGSVNVPLSPPCQDPAQLEKFFEQMGLEGAEYRYVSRTHSDSSDTPVFFSSVDSVDSNNCGWNAPWTPHGSGLANSTGGTAGTPGGMMGSGHSGKIIEQPSIVERNARIIKWLCNCRKAQKEMYQALGNGNVS